MRKKSILLGVILLWLPFVASATVVDTIVCMGRSITLTPQNTYPSDATFDWEVGGASVSSVPYYTLTVTGDVDVVLHVTGSATCDETFNIKAANNVSYAVFDTACDRYVWIDGNTYTASVTGPSVVFRSSQGCDSTVTLNLTVYNSNHSGTDTIKNACDVYVWKGHSYLVSGDYPFDTLTTHGCDSTVTLNLTVNHRSSGDTTAVACDSLTWHGMNYSYNGDYTIPAPTNVAGCDSTVTLHLTLRQSSAPVIYSATACDSYIWPLNNETYTANNDTAVAHLTNKVGCDSTVTLNLTIYNSNPSGTDTINACDVYVWKGNSYFATGDYPFDTLTTHGCDSTVTLNLTVNHSSSGDTTAVACDSLTWHGMNYSNSGDYTIPASKNAVGCDSTITLHLSIRQSSTPVVFPATACDSYVWPLNNMTYTASNNTAVAHLTNKAGCDSTVTLNLTVYNKHIDGAVFANVCDEYTWKNQTYYTSGNYAFDTLTTQGCDSTVTLYLTVRHRSSGDTTAVVCDVFTWYGTSCPATGSYQRLLAGGNAQNCDSTVTLHLTLRQSSTPVVYPATACDSYVWPLNNMTYTASNNTAVAHQTNKAGCDSTVTLNLTVNYSNVGTENADECDEYTWKNNTYYASGSYIFDTLTTFGCDSTVTLILTIRHSTTYTEVQNVCDSFTWNGQTYSTSGSDTRHFTNAQYCDSTATLNLTVRHSSMVTNLIDTVCDGYLWNGQTYTTTGIYTEQYINTQGCDSVVMLDLTVNNSSATNIDTTVCDKMNYWGQQYTQSNRYDSVFINTVGCDSIVTLDLTINRSTRGIDVQEHCDRYTWIDGITYSDNNNSATYTILNAAGCDSTVTLHLTIQKTVHTDVYDTACYDYKWSVNGQTYYASQVVTYPYSNALCMDTITLHLYIYDINGDGRPAVKFLKVKGGSTPWAIIYPRNENERDHLYQWYKGGEPIKGATKQYLALSGEAPGTTADYKVWVSDINVLECGSYSQTTVSFGATTSKSVRITPNPSNGHFEIAVEGDDLHAIRAEVYTLQGVRLMGIPMDGNYISVDSSLPQGSYLLRVVTEEGETISEKLVVGGKN